MRELQLDIPASPGPFYLRLAGAIRSAILEGRALPGELIPSSRRLAAQTSTHRNTVLTALEELVSEGWLQAEAGRGFRVTPTLPTEYDRTPGEERPREPVDWDFARTVEERFPEVVGDLFSSGRPDLRLFPTDELLACLREVLRRPEAATSLSYSDPAGSGPFREELQTYLRRLRGVAGGEIVVTHGSQEAIFCMALLLVKPGQTVAVEELGYPPAWNALRLAGARLVGLPVDQEGVDPEGLAYLIRQDRPAFIYLTPLHQYPTTVTLPIDRRLEILKLARQHRIPILEDDYDHEFHYRSRPPAPLAGHDTSGRVAYVSTLSKVVYPSARIGFAVLEPELALRFRAVRKAITRQNDNLVQEAMALWMSRGGFERHLRRMRRVYETRLEALVKNLERHGFEARKPGGGMSVWVDTGVDSVALARESKKLGLALRPGAEYRLHPGPSSHLRLGFTSADEEEIGRGVELLSRARDLVTP